MEVLKAISPVRLPNGTDGSVDPTGEDLKGPMKKGASKKGKKKIIGLKKLAKDRHGEEWTKLCSNGLGLCCVVQVIEGKVTCDCDTFMNEGQCLETIRYGLIFERRFPTSEEMPVQGPATDWNDVRKKAFDKMLSNYGDVDEDVNVDNSIFGDDFLSSKPPLVNPFGGKLERKLFRQRDEKIQYDVSYSGYDSKLGLMKYCEE